MKKLSGSALLAVTTGAFALAALPAGVAMAQSGADEQLEEVVTIGTRRKDRTALDTTVPMDVFNVEELDSVASDDLIDVIKTLVPSFNVGREPISDGATFVRPPQLRGLDSDKTLVLVNGKRRHRAALVRLGGFGSHGPDLSTIPSMALRSVEVLRDGASALYGSDAIAGVLNFNLKNASEGGQVRIQSGRYGDGDEASQLFAGNVGLPLGEDGFLNITMEYSEAEPTSRGKPYDISIAGSGLTPSQSAGVVQTGVDHDGFAGTATQTRYGPDALTEVYDATGNLLSIIGGSDGIADDTDTRYSDNLQFAEVSDSELTQIWGEPERDAIRMFLNAGFNLNESTQVYGWYNYSDSNSNGSFFHRRPGVSQLHLLRLPDGSIYNPRNRYPAGFTPRFAGNVIDQSLTGGIKGELDNGLSWDVGARWGENKISYNIYNTLNPSMGPSSPTDFRPGNLITDEIAFNADFSMPIDLGFAEDANIAFGFEYRDEGYQVELGGIPSWTVGPYASQDPWNFEITQEEVDADPADALTQLECRIPGQEALGTLCIAGDPINNAVPVGSNGFPGFGPSAASDFSRDSWAVYADFEADLSEDFLIQAAGRYEDFSDFGDNFSGRISGRYLLNDQFTLRGSFGTGFRAPTPGQLSTTNVSTRIAADGSPVAEGIFPATHAASQFFGSTGLDAETSTQFTFGLAATPVDNLSITLDYYFIALDDRLILSSDFAVDAAAVAALTAAGVDGANTIAQVSFFTNDIDSETQGLDLVATYNMESGAGLTTLSASANWNDTEVTRRTNHGTAAAPTYYLNAEDKFDNENGLPGFRSVLGVRHSFDNDLTLSVRGNWYGEYENANSSALTQIQTFDNLLQVDFDVTWDFAERYSLTFGGNNIFDSLPEEGQFETCCGRIYRSDSVVDWQGPYYYLRAAVKWD